MASHYHAYAWTGHERPPDKERVVPENPTPPLEIAHWLKKPARHVVETYDVDTGGGDALKWLESELDEYARHERDLPRDAQLAHARDCIDRGADVVWGYYSGRGRYVSRALVACPPQGTACPYGR